MNYLIVYGIISFLITNISCTYASTSDMSGNEYVFNFTDPKQGGKHQYLRRDFLEKVKKAFNVKVFIESGTYKGDTALVASDYFEDVYSIELSETLYKESCNKVKNASNVHLYLGDTVVELTHILPKLHGRALFWLDGHYSAGETAKGPMSCPLLAELDIIKKYGITDSVILIDDIRCCSYVPDWPRLDELVKAVLDINPNYKCALIGDILMVYIPQPNVGLSPLVRACTASRFAEIFVSGLYQVENEIAHAQGEEKEFIYAIQNRLGYDTYAPYFAHWVNLTNK